MERRSIMITGGAGLVGQFAVDYAVRRHEIKKVYIADIKEDIGVTTMKNAIVGSALHGYYTDAEFVKINLLDIDQTADVLKKLQPTSIFNCGTLISSYWYGPLIKYAIKEHQLETRGRMAGHTIAKDLTLIYYLMKAVQQSEIETRVVNIAFPDHTNPVLGRVGLAPACGGGTIDLTVTGLRKAVADRFKVPLRNVNVTMVAHHGIRAAPITDDMHWTRIRIGEEDVTSQIPDLSKFIESTIPYTATKVGINAAMTASSGFQNTMHVFNDDGFLGHAPGPAGEIGGYPCRFHWDKVEVVLPPGLTKEQALKINLEGMKADGIDRMDQDGTVHFSEETVAVLEACLGLDWKSMKPEQCYEMTKDLISAYKKLDEKYKGLEIGRMKQA
ncbi:MAG: NAD-dependent epimerase/dehydratase family protein [Candidatus Ranarchaeia archaeon]